MVDHTIQPGNRVVIKGRTRLSETVSLEGLTGKLMESMPGQPDHLSTVMVDWLASPYRDQALSLPLYCDVPIQFLRHCPPELKLIPGGIENQELSPVAA